MASIAMDQMKQRSYFSGDIPRSVMIVGFSLFLINIWMSGLLTPLWVDENFSAAIAVQPNIRGFIDWCLSELSGPVYYFILWISEKIIGDGNVALRLPSLAFTMAVPALIFWKGHDDRTIRHLWAINLALWQPGFYLATEARPYSLMLFLGCAQAICFLRLMKSASTSRAALWAGVSSLAVLTHYHAIIISGLQGVAYLVIWRRDAFRTWPALFVLLPMAAWMSWHLHTVLKYATSGSTWYQLLTERSVLPVLQFLCGTLLIVIVLAAMVPFCLYLRLSGMRLTESAPLLKKPEVVLIATGLLSVGFVVGMGFVRPSFSIRYLLPYVGAISLLLPLMLREVRGIAPAMPMIVVLLQIGSAFPPIIDRIANPLSDHRYSFNFEQPSAWIAAHSDARRLVFLWDNPSALLARSDKLADVGGFFFRRAGRAIDILIPHYAMNADPNPAVLALTDDRSDTAIIWAYDGAVPNSSGPLHPPIFPHNSLRWTCRDFGTGQIVVLACIPVVKNHGPVA